MTLKAVGRLRAGALLRGLRFPACRFPQSDRRRSVRGMLDWTQCSAVERVPGKVSGAWVFKGTRVTVAALFENLEGHL